MSVEKVNGRACKWFIHVIRFHVIDLDAKTSERRQVFDLDRKPQCLIQLIPVECASVELGSALGVRQDQLDLDVDLEVEVVEGVVKGHLSCCTVSCLLVSVGRSVARLPFYL